MRFLLDMGISIHLIPQLQAEGHEADHVVEFSDGTLSDTEILRRARAEDRVLLVHDLGICGSGMSAFEAGSASREDGGMTETFGGEG